MNIEQTNDRRRAPRIPLQKPVEVHVEHASSSISTTALNLSSTGICVGGIPGATVGDAVQCRLLFTPKEPLALSARVVWSTESEQAGLAFEEVTDHRGKRLEHFLGRLHGPLSKTPSGLTIDPFCESGTWSREILLDEELLSQPEFFEETAETLPSVDRYRRFFWGVMLGAMAGGIAAAAVTFALMR